MTKFFARIFFNLFGWRVNTNMPAEAKRCVMIAAPHTSNWDFFFMRAAFTLLDVPMRFAVKKEAVVFPIGGFMRWCGAIPIDRSPKKPGDNRPSLVESMIRFFEDRDELAVTIPPEGTRSLVTEWKSGFYHVALGAKVPICLGYLDFKKKEAGVGMVIHPSGDFEADMKIIANFYQHITPKHPKLFTLEKYLD